MKKFLGYILLSTSTAYLTVFLSFYIPAVINLFKGEFKEPPLYTGWVLCGFMASMLGGCVLVEQPKQKD